jgi:hypothetical protein
MEGAERKIASFFFLGGGGGEVWVVWLIYTGSDKVPMGKFSLKACGEEGVGETF